MSFRESYPLLIIRYFSLCEIPEKYSFTHLNQAIKEGAENRIKCRFHFSPPQRLVKARFTKTRVTLSALPIVLTKNEWQLECANSLLISDVCHGSSIKQRFLSWRIAGGCTRLIFRSYWPWHTVMCTINEVIKNAPLAPWWWKGQANLNHTFSRSIKPTSVLRIKTTFTPYIGTPFQGFDKLTCF